MPVNEFVRESAVFTRPPVFAVVVVVGSHRVPLTLTSIAYKCVYESSVFHLFFFGCWSPSQVHMVFSFNKRSTYNTWQCMCVREQFCSIFFFVVGSYHVPLRGIGSSWMYVWVNTYICTNTYVCIHVYMYM